MLLSKLCLKCILSTGVSSNATLSKRDMSTKQDSLAQYYLGLGLILRPYHTIAKNGKCTCGKKCPNPGKHPILPKNMYIKTFEEYVAFKVKYPLHNLAVATGYYSKNSRSLVVIDVDDPYELDFVKSILPVDDTLSVKTKKGYHFWFWVNGTGVNAKGDYSRNFVWVNTAIQFENHRVDVLGQKRNVLVPGSTDKEFQNHSDILTLTPEQAKRIQTKQRISLASIKKNTEQKIANGDVPSLESGNVVRGQYNTALTQASTTKLRREREKLLSGEWTLVKHTEWLIAQAVKYLPPPVNLSQVAQIAKSNFQNFDHTKCLSSEAHFDKVASNLSAEDRAILHAVVTEGFVDLPKKKFQQSKEPGMSCAQVKEQVIQMFKNAGGKAELYIGDMTLMAMLRCNLVVKKTKVEKKGVDGVIHYQKMWWIKPVKFLTSSTSVTPTLSSSPLFPSQEINGGGLLQNPFLASDDTSKSVKVVAPVSLTEKRARLEVRPAVKFSFEVGALLSQGKPVAETAPVPQEPFVEKIKGSGGVSSSGNIDRPDDPSEGQQRAGLNRVAETTPGG